MAESNMRGSRCAAPYESLTAIANCSVIVLRLLDNKTPAGISISAMKIIDKRIRFNQWRLKETSYLLE